MSVEPQVCQRLYNAAEAFFYAGILTSLRFDALNVDSGDYREPVSAAEAAAFGRNRQNTLGAPPLVNFSLSIELYLKLLIVLSGRRAPKDHDLYRLFLHLEKGAPQAAAHLVRNHPYALGCRQELLDSLMEVAKVFQQWRYGHESEFLCSSADALLVIASACRKTVSESRPDLQRVFGYRPRPEGSDNSTD